MPESTSSPTPDVATTDTPVAEAPVADQRSDALDTSVDSVDDVVNEIGDVVEGVEEAADGVAEDVARSVFVLREVIGRQVVAGQGLANDLIDLATDVGEVLVHAPAVVVAAIRGGATLPAAVSQSGSVVSEAVVNAGDRLRTAVGGYVERQATLPNALLSGAAGVASTVVRAQGTVGGSAVNAVFAVAAVATNGGDVRDVFDRELDEVNAKAESARGQISESLKTARREIVDAVIVDEESSVPA
ncbi:MAG: hypothetical protein ACSLE6_20670 [Mycobacterium sp.]